MITASSSICLSLSKVSNKNTHFLNRYPQAWNYIILNKKNTLS